MSTFKYTARDRVGKAVAGIIDASGMDIARRLLGEKDYIPITLKEIKAKGEGFSLNILRRRVSAKDIIVFNRQLAALFGAGIPLIEAIQALAEQTVNKVFQKALQNMSADIQAGTSFSAALAKHPNIFSDLYVNMIQAGEASGTLDDILKRLASLSEHEAETKAKIKAATRYPKIVISAMIIAIVILMKFVVPTFMLIFKEVKLELPLATRMLILANDIFLNYWYVFFGAAGCVYFAFKSYIKTRQGRWQIDKFKLNVPIFGPIFHKVAMSSFARTMATLNRSGLPIIKSLEMCADVVNNVVIADVIHKVKEGVKRGENMAGNMRQSKLFTPMVIQMVSAGEEAGELDSMLEKVSEYYDMEVDIAIKNLSSLIEPVLLVFLGAGVLFLMLAIFLPMWDLVKIAKQS